MLTTPLKLEFQQGYMDYPHLGITTLPLGLMCRHWRHSRPGTIMQGHATHKHISMGCSEGVSECSSYHSSGGRLLELDRGHLEDVLTGSSHEQVEGVTSHDGVELSEVVLSHRAANVRPEKQQERQVRHQTRTATELELVEGLAHLYGTLVCMQSRVW